MVSYKQQNRASGEQLSSPQQAIFTCQCFSQTIVEFFFTRIRLGWSEGDILATFTPCGFFAVVPPLKYPLKTLTWWCCWTFSLFFFFLCEHSLNLCIFSLVVSSFLCLIIFHFLLLRPKLLHTDKEAPVTRYITTLHFKMVWRTTGEPAVFWLIYREQRRMWSFFNYMECDVMGWSFTFLGLHGAKSNFIAWFDTCNLRYMRSSNWRKIKLEVLMFYFW